MLYLYVHKLLPSPSQRSLVLLSVYCVCLVCLKAVFTLQTKVTLFPSRCLMYVFCFDFKTVIMFTEMHISFSKKSEEKI